MSLADDWGKHGITVNCLAPGWFRTEQNKVMYEDKECWNTFAIAFLLNAQASRMTWTEP